MPPYRRGVIRYVELAALAMVLSSAMSGVCAKAAAASLIGPVVPVVTGLIVGVPRSRNGPFLIADIALVVGIFASVVLFGAIEPVPDPAAVRAVSLVRDASAR